MRYLIIGDVHADYPPLERAINFACSNDLHLVSVGDIVDGKQDGAKCVSELNKLLDSGKASIIKGNHEHKIIRALNGADVILGPPNVATLNQMEQNSQFEADFRHMVEDHCKEYVKINENIYVTHGGMHKDFWEAEKTDTVTKKMFNTMMFGEADYKKTFRHNDQDYPYRTYDWKDSVPGNVTLVVGHDPAPLEGQPDFDNFQIEPTVHTNDMGGTTVWLDAGAGKGGALFGLVVNSSTNEIEDTINFTNG
jgi:hypothetical protein